MDGEAAELLVTDPPFGVDYVGKTDRRMRIAGDGPQGLEGLLSESFAALDEALCPGARLYVFHPAGELSLLFGNTFVAQAGGCARP
jgi:site-specific DNA-methyltransferase (adenine-specific)